MTTRQNATPTSIEKLSGSQHRVMRWLAHGWAATPGAGSTILVNGERICNVDTMTALSRMGLVATVGKESWRATAAGKALAPSFAYYGTASQARSNQNTTEGPKPARVFEALGGADEVWLMPGLTINAPAFWRDPEFLAWFVKSKSKDIHCDRQDMERSYATLFVDPRLNGRGDNLGMPDKFWTLIVEMCRKNLVRELQDAIECGVSIRVLLTNWCR